MKKHCFIRDSERRIVELEKQRIIEAWRVDYNTDRPHSRLAAGHVTGELSFKR